MKERKATVIERIGSELFVSPHIVGLLIDLVMGEWQPSSAQQEQLIAHFTKCSYCRTAIIVLLSAEPEHSETVVQDLLTQFITIHHEIEGQEHEHIGAYAEMIVTQGREEANRSFPTLAKHIRGCSRCKLLLEETLKFLNGLKETD